MRQNDYFMFDGVDSRTFDCIIFDSDTFSSPVKEFGVASVPGRSGDLLLNNRRFSNVEHVYDVIIYRNFAENFDALREFLLGRDGYCRLEDSLHPDEFYTAYFSESITPEITRERDMGKFKLVFNRKPQRWLKVGEEPVYKASGSSSMTLRNPTNFPTYPMIKIWGTTVDTNFTISQTNNIIKIAYTQGASWLNPRTEALPLYFDMETLQAYGWKTASATSPTYVNELVKYTIPTSKQYRPYTFQIPPKSFMSSFVLNIPSSLNAAVIPRWYKL